MRYSDKQAAALLRELASKLENGRPNLPTNVVFTVDILKDSVNIKTATVKPPVTDRLIHLVLDATTSQIYIRLLPSVDTKTVHQALQFPNDNPSLHHYFFRINGNQLARTEINDVLMVEASNTYKRLSWFLACNFQESTINDRPLYSYFEVSTLKEYTDQLLDSIGNGTLPKFQFLK